VDKLTFFFNVLPYLTFLYAGVFAILGVLFPSCRGPDFNRWEVAEGSGSSVTILGWKKMLRPPRVLAQGYMSDGAARAVASVVGVIFVLIATFGIRHVTGFPVLVPDVFNRF
jgi:hypothetical protein